MSGAYPALSAALSCPALSTSSPFLVPAAHTTAISLEERENVVEQERKDAEKFRILHFLICCITPWIFCSQVDLSCVSKSNKHDIVPCGSFVHLFTKGRSESLSPLSLCEMRGQVS